MDAYRVYGLDAHGRIRTADYIDCPGDEEALAEARRFLEGYPAAEIWFGRRKVGDIRTADPDKV